MKKTILLFAVFAVLGSLAAWYISQGEPKSTRSVGEKDFGMEKIEDVYKIFIADRSGVTTTLERKKGHWLYNGEFVARKNAVENLLDVIRRVSVRYVVARAAVDNIVKDLAVSGIKVELYDRENKKIKGYYVGGMTNDELGTYMIMEGAEEPYVTHIPSWEGGLRARFQLKGQEWRDRHVFNEDPETIQGVSMEYPGQKSKSFKLVRTDDGFDVSPFFEITPRSKRPFKTGSPDAFLMMFEGLQAEAFQNKHDEREDISSRLPFCKVVIDYKDGTQKTADFYPIVQYDDNGNILSDADVLGSNTAVERYHALVNNKDFVLLQQRIFGKVFWAYDSFFQ